MFANVKFFSSDSCSPAGLEHDLVELEAVQVIKAAGCGTPWHQTLTIIFILRD